MNAVGLLFLLASRAMISSAASMTQHVIASGGAESWSTHYRVLCTAGQSAIGPVEGPEASAHLGYYVPGALLPTASTSAPPVTTYWLRQNFPNPFNPTTTIEFGLPAPSPVRLVVVDVSGRELMRLVDGVLGAGVHKVDLDATGLPSGMYLYRIEAGAFVESRRLVLLK